MDDRGSYFEAYNHNSRQSYEHGKSLRSAMFPWLTTLVVFLVLAVPAFFTSLANDGIGAAIMSLIFAAVVVAITMWIVGSILGAIRASRAKADSRFKQFKAQLANEPVNAASANVAPSTV